MKKRKAKRIKGSTDIELEIQQSIDEREKIREEALIDLIVKIIVKITWDEYYNGDDESS
jgi:hypothetical protein